MIRLLWMKSTRTKRSNDRSEKCPLRKTSNQNNVVVRENKHVLASLHGSPLWHTLYCPIIDQTYRPRLSTDHSLSNNIVEEFFANLPKESLWNWTSLQNVMQHSTMKLGLKDRIDMSTPMTFPSHPMHQSQVRKGWNSEDHHLHYS